MSDPKEENKSGTEFGSSACYADDQPEVEYVMRVKLPSSSSYHSGPSGDTEYDEAYNRAIREAKPVGFEVSWKTQSTWPKDKDGVTWVKLYCSNESDAIDYWKAENVRLKIKVKRILEFADAIKSA